MVDLELLSADGDPSKLLGQFATLLLSFSFLVSLPILLLGTGRMPPEPTWIMEHFLIATTMVVVGLFAVLSWDSAFPDRQDVLVLGPLPVRTQTLFFAKLAAFAASLALPVLALNAFAGLLWPLLFSSAGSGFLGAIRALAAYWFTVLAAATFVSGFTLLIQGAATQLLPRQLFLRVSALLQVLTFCLFLTMYVLEPSLESVAARTNPTNQHLLACLPTYWFLGLFQQLNGTMDPGFIPLANRAWMGLAITVLGTEPLLLAYFRSLRKIVEQPDILPGSRRGSWSPRLGDNLQSAVLLFTARTLTRSRQHRIILSFYLGVGFTIMLVFLSPSLASLKIAHVSASEQASVPFLAVSILMMCVAAAAVRVVFALPMTLRANWIYRITEIRCVALYTKALRRTFLLLVVAPVWTIFAVLFFAIWPWKLAAHHLVCRIARNHPRRTRHLPIPQSPFHLLLSARQGKCAIRILDLFRAPRALAPRRRNGMGDAAGPRIPLWSPCSRCVVWPSRQDGAPQTRPGRPSPCNSTKSRPREFSLNLGSDGVPLQNRSSST